MNRKTQCGRSVSFLLFTPAGQEAISSHAIKKKEKKKNQSSCSLQKGSSAPATWVQVGILQSYSLFSTKFPMWVSTDVCFFAACCYVNVGFSGIKQAHIRLHLLTAVSTMNTSSWEDISQKRTTWTNRVLVGVMLSRLHSVSAAEKGETFPPHALYIHLVFPESASSRFKTHRNRRRSLFCHCYIQIIQNNRIINDWSSTEAVGGQWTMECLRQILLISFRSLCTFLTAKWTDTNCTHVKILCGTTQFAELVAEGFRHDPDTSAVWKANWWAADADGPIRYVKLHLFLTQLPLSSEPSPLYSNTTDNRRQEVLHLFFVVWYRDRTD